MYLPATDIVAAPGALAALNATSSPLAALDGRATVTFDVRGTFVGTIIPEVSADGGAVYDALPNWMPIFNRSTGKFVSGITVPGIYMFDAAGLTSVRLKMAAFTSGTANVKARASFAAFPSLAHLAVRSPTNRLPFHIVNAARLAVTALALNPVGSLAFADGTTATLPYAVPTGKVVRFLRFAGAGFSSNFITASTGMYEDGFFGIVAANGAAPTTTSQFVASFPWANSMNDANAGSDVTLAQQFNHTIPDGAAEVRAGWQFNTVARTSNGNSMLFWLSLSGYLADAMD